MGSLTRDDLLRATTDQEFARLLVERHGLAALVDPECEDCLERSHSPLLFEDDCGCRHGKRRPFHLLPRKLQALIRERNVVWP